MTHRVMVFSAGSLDPHGPVAAAIANLWWLMLVLSAVVFTAFCALLALGLLRRPRDDDPHESVRIRRWILGGGVVMPVIVLVGVFGATLYTMRVLPSDIPQDALVVEVVARQWGYEVRYPNEDVIVENELHLPVGRPVALRLTSVDVIHSFWVPELGGKMDMLPDATNTLVLEADRPGEHIARCAEFCGLHHATMKMRVIAEQPKRFEAWISTQS